MFCIDKEYATVSPFPPPEWVFCYLRGEGNWLNTPGHSKYFKIQILRKFKANGLHLAKYMHNNKNYLKKE